MARPQPPATVAVGAAALAVLLAAGGISVAHAMSGGRPTPGPAAPDAGTGRPPAAAPVQPVSVPPLRRLTAPDVLVTLRHRADPRAVARLRRRPGIGPVAVLDAGRVRVRHHRLAAIGVDPGQVRGFTPDLTARSDPLWRSVAGGEMTLAYGSSRIFRHDLGRTLPVHAARAVPVRVGAFASLGLGDAQAVVDHAVADRLGLRPRRRLVVAAPHLSVTAIADRVHAVLGPGARVHDARPQVRTAVTSTYARATIPSSYLSLYQSAAATCPGLPWTVLAGIGEVETGHGAVVHRSTKGAVGPMQFLPSTFATYGIDGDGDGVADIHDPSDAVYSAARYLCLWGAGRGGQSLYDAVFAYNHADWYVREVFAYANAYA